MKSQNLLILGLAVLAASCGDSEWYDEYFGETLMCLSVPTLMSCAAHHQW